MMDRDMLGETTGTVKQQKTARQRAIDALNRLTDNDGPATLSNRSHEVVAVVDTLLEAAREPAEPGSIIDELREAVRRLMNENADAARREQSLRMQVEEKNATIVQFRQAVKDKDREIESRVRHDANVSAMLGCLGGEDTYAGAKRVMGVLETTKLQRDQHGHELDEVRRVLKATPRETALERARTVMATTTLVAAIGNALKEQREKLAAHFDESARSQFNAAEKALAEAGARAESNGDKAAEFAKAARHQLCAQLWRNAAAHVRET